MSAQKVVIGQVVASTFDAPVAGIPVDCAPASTGNIPDVVKPEIDAAVKKQLNDTTEDGTPLVHHVLVDGDSLMTLALRYGSSIGGIMRCNGMLSDDVDMLPLGCLLHIPLTHDASLKPQNSLGMDLQQTELRRQKDLIEKFAETNGVKPHEAKYYLSDNNWCSKTAQVALREDVTWEKSQPAASKVATRGGLKKAA